MLSRIISAAILAALPMAVPAAMAACPTPAALAFCGSCHELDPAKPSKATGPNISDVYGGHAAIRADYTKYSEAMKAAAGKGLVWTDQAISAYLADQRTFLKSVNGIDLKNTMAITTHKAESKRLEAIAALKNLKASCR